MRGDDDPQSDDGGDGADQAFAGASYDVLEGGRGADVLRGETVTTVSRTIRPASAPGPTCSTAVPARTTRSLYQGRGIGVWIDLARAAPQGAPGEGDLLAGFERAEGATAVT